MKKIAVFPGSFDPITVGHIEIIERGLNIFDEVVVGIGVNSSKTTLFTAEQRANCIQEHFKNENRIRTQFYNQLTVQFCQELGAGYILRGLRNAADFDYERGIDLINKHLNHEVETVYLISSPHTSHISSSLVREVIRYGGKLQNLVPDSVIAALSKNNR